jgi:hypothetical protein
MQICCHPQVGASGAAAAAGSASRLKTMDEVLKALIGRDRVEAEDAQRCMLAACNGVAGLHILAGERGAAVVQYRRLLAAAAKHAGLCDVDSLQQMHALVNLGATPSIVPHAVGVIDSAPCYRTLDRPRAPQATTAAERTLCCGRSRKRWPTQWLTQSGHRMLCYTYAGELLGPDGRGVPGVEATPGERTLAERARELQSKYLAAPEGRLLMAEAEYNADIDKLLYKASDAKISEATTGAVGLRLACAATAEWHTISVPVSSAMPID